MKLLSLFSGIGGIELALESAGMKTIAQVEISDNCRSILERHWPSVERFKDVRDFKPASLSVRPELIAGGFPCQDISLAGKRHGLDGASSGLWFEFHRIIAQVRPRWVLIENVVDLLTAHDGNDFAIILKALDELGYGCGWRILDAQWFGIPQQRRRLFVVGCFNDFRRAAAVLFEPDKMPWDHPSCAVKKPRHSTATVKRTGSMDQPIIFQPRIGRCGRGYSEGVVPALTGADAGATSDMRSCVASRQHGVRRLTPTEHERLMGLPDGHTELYADGSEVPDVTRYQVIANSVVVPVVKWIGERMMAA